MKKTIVVLALILLMSSAAMSQSFYEHNKGQLATVSSVSISADHTGDWTHACSTSTTTFTPLDSGGVLLELSGIALMHSGQTLYFGMDKVTADSSVNDTGYAWGAVTAPMDITGIAFVPFNLRDVYACDSGAVKASASATFSCGSSTDAITVSNIVLTQSMISAKTK